MIHQLTLDFREEIIRKNIGGKEYRRLRLLGPSKNTRHYLLFVHDAICENYEEEQYKHRYFDSKEERDAYLNELKTIYVTDQHGNDIGGNIPTGIYEDGKFTFGIVTYPKICDFHFAEYKNILDKKA